jgi:hypothetical protein
MREGTYQLVLGEQRRAKEFPAFEALSAVPEGTDQIDGGENDLTRTRGGVIEAESEPELLMNNDETDEAK